jgi:KaiC/GvpD/RAD55 family RecA-like ATPase
MELISTGYDELDEYLGGGLVRGSTNLIIERGGFLGRHGCWGDLFCIFILRNRINARDIGLIDCFSTTPAQIINLAKSYGIDLTIHYNEGKLHFLDFSSLEITPITLGVKEVDLTTFASQYVEKLHELVSKGNVINIVISFTSSILRYGETDIYWHLMNEKKLYESTKRTSLYLVEGIFHTEEYIDRLKPLFDTVIALKVTGWGKGVEAYKKEYRRILFVEKSKISARLSIPLEYEIKLKPTPRFEFYKI